MNQKFYYGQPQVLWDMLCAEAEDLLQEEQLGTHLVAVYPAGNRIYGLESCPPGLFCLYVDSVEALINPLSDYHKQSGFKVFSVGNNYSPIIMADIFKWTQWIVSRCNDWRARAFLHAIPFGQHVIHEDESISNILEACYQAMKDVNFTTWGIDNNSYTSYIEPHAYLHDRTMAILYNKGKFFPNINPDWDKVINSHNLGIDLKEKDIQLDINIQKEILEDNSCHRLLPVWDMFVPKTGYKYPINGIKNDTLKSISDSVMDFYRFQL